MLRDEAGDESHNGSTGSVIGGHRLADADVDVFGIAGEWISQGNRPGEPFEPAGSAEPMVESMTPTQWSPCL